MNEKIALIAERIRGLRDMLGISAEDMARAVELSPEEYAEYEAGTKDYSFTFLYKAAGRLGVDITELLTGDMPKLKLFSLIRAGEGLPIERRRDFSYQHMAYLFKDKAAEPFCVTAKYDEAEEGEPVALSRHEGQEFDYILEGSLRMKIEDHEFIMNPGDAVYYDARHGHGMAAHGGKDCRFLAVVIKTEGSKM